MANGDNGIIEKGKKAIDKVTGVVDHVVPTETPTIKLTDTGSRDDVEQQLGEDVPPDKQEECRRKCAEKEMLKTWSVWDWKLELSPGKDFEGKLWLSWKCDCCYVYNVKAWHTTPINTVPVVVSLEVETSKGRPGPRRIVGDCAPCKPIGMEVHMHLTLGEKSGLGKVQLPSPPKRSYHVRVTLPAPCGKAVEPTEPKPDQYKSQMSPDDYTTIHTRGKSLSDVGNWGIYPDPD